MARFTLLVIGDDAYKKVEVFAEDREVEPHVVKRHSKRARSRQRWIRRQRRTLWKVDLTRNLDSVLEDYLEKVEMTPDEYYDWSTSYIGGDQMPRDENGDVVSTVNPRGKTDYWGCRELPLRGELEPAWEAEGRYCDIDWEHLREHARMGLIECWAAETLLDPQFIDRLFVDTYEEYLDVYSRFYTSAVIDDEGDWHSPGMFRWFISPQHPPPVEKTWILNFQARFLDNLEPETLLTKFSCHY